MSKPTLDYYELLEVHPKASIELIKKAYLLLAKRYHPDSTVLEKTEAHQKMSALNNAYETLSDPQKRKSYDLTRSSKADDVNHNNSSSTYINFEGLVKNENAIIAHCTSLNQALATSLRNENDSGKIFLVCNDVYTSFSRQINPLIEKQIVLSQGNYEKYLKLSFSTIASLLHNIGLGYAMCGAIIESNELLKRAYTYAQFDQQFQITIKNQIQKNLTATKNIVSSPPNNKKQSRSLLLLVGIGALIIYLLSTFSAPSKKTAPPTVPPVKSSQTQTNTLVTPPPKPSTPPDNSVKRPSLPPQNILSQYVPNVPLKNNTGLNIVEVDNSQNDYPVFVKLFYHSPSGKQVPVREFTIKQGESFQLNDVTIGKYDLRYEVLNTGNKFKTEPFSLDEKKTSTGTQYSRVKFTLYKVRGGNAQTFSISDNDFK